eukprot:scaffold18612_cov118-Isochrysis_galbana.AAC.5
MDLPPPSYGFAFPSRHGAPVCMGHSGCSLFGMPSLRCFSSEARALGSQAHRCAPASLPLQPPLGFCCLKSPSYACREALTCFCSCFHGGGGGGCPLPNSCNCYSARLAAGIQYLQRFVFVALRARAHDCEAQAEGVRPLRSSWQQCNDNVHVRC